MKKTETINKNSLDLDLLSSEEFVELYLQEDKQVWQALEKAKQQIAHCIDQIFKQFQGYPYWKDQTNYEGPKVFYCGAGTSGRLGILDASECPPTFSVAREMFQGIIAGGDKAIQESVEAAEDNYQAGFDEANQLNQQDSLVAISANGNAEFVCGAIEAANKQEALTIAIANNEDAKIFKLAQEKIFLDTGAEILSGSTRLKAGTAQKITLNMISTGLMNKLGKTYKNLMVDVKASNHKLKERAQKLVMEVTGCGQNLAEDCLKKQSYRVKHAIVQIACNIDNENEINEILAKNKGSLRKSLELS